MLCTEFFYFVEVCFDMFIIMPMAAIETARAVPPELMNGSGTPVIGIRPIIELILKNA